MAGKVGDQLGLFAVRMREGLLAASVANGLDVMGELMAAEVTELAGPKGKHNPAGRTAYRHGDEDGTVVLGGRKLPVRRPRVRGVGAGWPSHGSSAVAHSAQACAARVGLTMRGNVSANRCGCPAQRAAQPALPPLPLRPVPTGPNNARTHMLRKGAYRDGRPARGTGQGLGSGR